MDLVDLEYAYANARVKAMKVQLFDKHRMRELMDVGSLAEVIEMLEESPYKNACVRASANYSGIELVKRALDEELKLLYRKVLRIAPPKARPLIELLLKQWEVNNVKKALAAKALGRKLELSDFLIVAGEDPKLLEQISSKPDLEGALKTLAGSEYGPVISKSMEQYRATGDFRVILAALDENYLGRLAKQAQSPSLDDHTRRFIMRRIECAQAMAILRMRHSGMDSAQIRKYLKRAPLWQTGLLTKMVEADGVEPAVRVLCGEPYVDKAAILEKAARNNLPGVEVELEKALLASARHTYGTSVLSLGVLVGYLFLKQEEVHSIRKIAYATQFDVRQEIRETILATV